MVVAMVDALTNLNDIDGFYVWHDPRKRIYFIRFDCEGRSVAALLDFGATFDEIHDTARELIEMV